MTHQGSLVNGYILNLLMCKSICPVVSDLNAVYTPEAAQELLCIEFDEGVSFFCIFHLLEVDKGVD